MGLKSLIPGPYPGFTVFTVVWWAILSVPVFFGNGSVSHPKLHIDPGSHPVRTPWHPKPKTLHVQEPIVPVDLPEVLDGAGFAG